MLRHLWGLYAAATPQRWALPMVVLVDGAVAGVQLVEATDFAVAREVVTGSWLTASAQGRGVGTTMRTMILHLAFRGLDAHTARSSARADNVASNRVSQKVGYALDGTTTVVRRGQRTVDHRYVMTREAWLSSPASAADVEISGVDDCRGWFGADRITG